MVKDIQNIINPLKLSVSGIHGLEYTNELGKYLINDMEPIPLYIYEKLFKFSKNYPGSFIEKKNISVALHYRNAPGMEKKAINFIVVSPKPVPAKPPKLERINDSIRN